MVKTNTNDKNFKKIVDEAGIVFNDLGGFDEQRFPNKTKKLRHKLKREIKQLKQDLRNEWNESTKDIEPEQIQNENEYNKFTIELRWRSWNRN